MDDMELRERVIRNDEQIKTIFRKLEEYGESHKELNSHILAVRQKIFNGYDSTITTTKEKVDAIVKALEEHMGTAHFDESGIQRVVVEAISAYEQRKKAEKALEKRDIRRWWAEYGKELIIAISAIGMFVMTVLNFIIQSNPTP
jgi:hypothetical protein